MTYRRTFATLIALMTLPFVVTAQQVPHPHGPRDVDFDHFLLSPEMVMEHQRDIALTAEQRGTITTVIKELQGEVLDLQWAMKEAQLTLAEMLDTPSIDLAAALAQVDAVLDIERQVKRAHFTHLIRIKNALTPEQQEKLHQLSRHTPSHNPGLPRRRGVGRHLQVATEIAERPPISSVASTLQ